MSEAFPWTFTRRESTTISQFRDSSWHAGSSAAALARSIGPYEKIDISRRMRTKLGMRQTAQDATINHGSKSPKAWVLVLAWVIGFKIAYFAGLYGGLVFWPDMDVHNFHTMMQRWPRAGGPVFASHFATWDAAHYLYLSEVGYAPGVPACAFYPLWPLLMRWTAPLFGGSHLWSGLILANALSAIAFVLFHRVAAKRFGEKTASWALILLVVYPGSLFFQFIYSEALFFLLLMVLWWALEGKLYAWAWFAACLLPLSRAVGVFCILPIAWHLLSTHPVSTQGKGPGTSSAGEEPHRDSPRWTNLRYYPLLAAPLLGWAVYLASMRAWTGDAFWGFKAQKFWGVHSVWNIINVPKFLFSFVTPLVFHEFRGSLLDRLMFMLLIYTLPVIWRLEKNLLPWVYFLGILPAMSGEFTSYTRFASTVFPMFLGLAVFVTGKRSLWGRFALLGVFGLLHLLLLWRFVNFRWAG
jgi:hypothetical protein